jgi:hypothetical protein
MAFPLFKFHRSLIVTRTRAVRRKPSPKRIPLDHAAIHYAMLQAINARNMESLFTLDQ